MAQKWNNSLSTQLPANKGIIFYSNKNTVEYWMCDDYDSGHFGSSDLPANKTVISNVVSQLSCCTNHASQHDCQINMANSRIERWSLIQPDCTGHCKRRLSNTFSLTEQAQAQNNTLIKKQTLTELYNRINEELNERKTHPLFSAPAISSKVRVPTADLIQTSNLTTIINKLQNICEANDGTGTINNISIDSPSVSSIIQTTDINESFSNKIVQKIIPVIQDCICYSDCVGYSVCYCYGNCNHY